MLTPKTSRRILLAVGLMFIFSGIVVIILNLNHVISATYSWQGPGFLVLGITGFLTSYFGLSKIRVLSLIIIFLAYVPWTVIGLMGDFKQGYWVLVVGESIGLTVILISIISLSRNN